MPNSRFEVLEAKTIPGRTKVGFETKDLEIDADGFVTQWENVPSQVTYQLPEGLELTVRETSALPKTEARTKGILGKLKANRLLNQDLDRIQQGQ
jgi:hypothetical protein